MTTFQKKKSYNAVEWTPPFNSSPFISHWTAIYFSWHLDVVKRRYIYIYKTKAQAKPAKNLVVLKLSQHPFTRLRATFGWNINVGSTIAFSGRRKGEYAMDCTPHINKRKGLRAYSNIICPQRVTADFVWVVFKGPPLSLCIINIIIMLHARFDLRRKVKRDGFRLSVNSVGL